MPPIIGNVVINCLTIFCQRFIIYFISTALENNYLLKKEVKNMLKENKELMMEQVNFSGLKIRTVASGLKEMIAKGELVEGDIRRFLKGKEEEYSSTQKFQGNASQLRTIIGALDEERITEQDILDSVRVEEADKRQGTWDRIKTFFSK